MTPPPSTEHQVPKQPSLWRECVSRGVMVILGGGMAYLGLRAISYLARASADAPAPLVFWVLSFVVAALVGTMVVAKVLPVGVMQSLFERWNRPPVTGDRDPGDDAWFWNPRRWWHGEWWWW